MASFQSSIFSDFGVSFRLNLLMALSSEDAVYHHRLVGDGRCYGCLRTVQNKRTCAVHELALIDACLILIQAYLGFLL